MCVCMLIIHEGLLAPYTAPKESKDPSVVPFASSEICREVEQIIFITLSHLKRARRDIFGSAD